MQESKAKSRHLPLIDFFEILQLEWIQADLRHKVYPRLKDKLYWEKVKNGKQVNIEALAERNGNLPTIFSDNGMYIDLQKKVYREHSYPLFSYRDHDHEMEQSYYDLKYYYNMGADVRVKIDEDIVTGKISKEYIPFKDSHVTITVGGVEGKYSISKVTRIL